ncbi:MAG: hypothetical protein K2X82_28950 [Gemmataceae bacterium]|nr:hypothetical protein [Gemmataceae bacterium]
MNFAVVYTPSAENDLADGWLRAPDRNAVSEAADRVDRRLGRDPLNEGESRDDDLRVMFEPPLAVFYTVDVAAATVRVVRVRLRTGPRP